MIYKEGIGFLTYRTNKPLQVFLLFRSGYLACLGLLETKVLTIERACAYACACACVCVCVRASVRLRVWGREELGWGERKRIRWRSSNVLCVRGLRSERDVKKWAWSVARREWWGVRVLRHLRSKGYVVPWSFRFCSMCSIVRDWSCILFCHSAGLRTEENVLELIICAKLIKLID